MKKTFTLGNFCKLLAIAAAVHGTYASISHGTFYWHIFMFAAMFYNIAAADKKSQL